MEHKTINFKGKHNIDKIESIVNANNTAKRTHMNSLVDTEISHCLQVDMVNKLYMNLEFNLKSLLEKELNSKITGYKNQDVKKDIYDADLLITFVNVIEKLMSIKLRCCYCRLAILLLYKNVREPTQWTLDRIDNNKCHSNENTVIACLKCNLQRRLTNIDKFTFTKHLKIKKC
jgi:hypothetical protein